MKEILFEDAYTAWRSEAPLMKTSLAKYDRIYSYYMDEYIGSKNVRNITEKDIDLICENFRSHGLSADYGGLIHSVLTDVYNWCIKQGYIAAIPFVIKINV